jgi:uridine kinase
MAVIGGEKPINVLETVAADLAAIDVDHPLRVAVDGITAAGKTTFANGLGAIVAALGRDVIRISMDGFHNPRALRYRQGRGSPDGYYEDAYDFAALRQSVLEPLGDDGDRRYRTAIIDLAADVPVSEADTAAPVDAVLIVDGSFLQKPVLRGAWDVVVYLRASFGAAERRGAARDAQAFGGEEAAAAAFRSRYHAAQRRYIAECAPELNADIVIDVEDPSSPRIARRLGRPGS